MGQFKKELKNIEVALTALEGIINLFFDEELKQNLKDTSYDDLPMPEKSLITKKQFEAMKEVVLNASV